MEDDVSSILYIIITAIIILVGILGKKKKPQQIPNSSNGETGGMGFFEKLGFKDPGEGKERFSDIEEEEATETTEREQHESIVTSAFEVRSDKKDEVTQKAFDEETEEGKAFKISDEFDYEIDEIKDEFDLKKAIIYSEIINRKYE